MPSRSTAEIASLQMALVASLYGIAFSEREQELLRTPRDLLSNLERQDKFLLLMSVEPVQCPACGTATCQKAAWPEGTGVHDLVDDDDYRCPACGTRLVWHLLVDGAQVFTVHPDDYRTPVVST